MGLSESEVKAMHKLGEVFREAAESLTKEQKCKCMWGEQCEECKPCCDNYDPLDIDCTELEYEENSLISWEQFSKEWAEYISEYTDGADGGVWY